jgi:hypothetical protein
VRCHNASAMNAPYCSSPSSIDTIDITVRGGGVSLRGYAATPVSKARAEVAASSIAGVLRVVNQIVTDGELVAAVEQALARPAHPRTTDRRSVRARRGVSQRPRDQAGSPCRCQWRSSPMCRMCSP